MLKIVCDDRIPLIRPALEALAGELVLKPGAAICRSDVADAAILVVRTRTRCDSRLLQDTAVRLVVTATIGHDHLDTAWLERQGIAWANCPGCNATSVGQYVLCSLLTLEQERAFSLRRATVGIVGAGHVGTAVAQALRSAGAGRILYNDPPRQLAGHATPDGSPWSPMERLLEEADVITFHTPLTHSGPHATYHLAGQAFFSAARRQPVIINAARGGVVDEQALLSAMQQGRVRDAIIDTWEHEPQPWLPLLQSAFIGTPHIAGYSADGKANATRMTLQHICRFLRRTMDFSIQPPALPPGLLPADDPAQRALQLYDPRSDSRRLKARPAAFEQLRGDYPLRRESFN